MLTFTLFMVALFGLCFGSFVTLASHRLPQGEDIVCGRSHCPDCGSTLGWRDLFPVISWVVQAGRCRYCHVAISPRYPLIELVTAALFIGIYHLYGLSQDSILLMLMSVALMVMVVTDLEEGIIPDEVHLALLALGLGYHATIDTPSEPVVLGFVVALVAGLLLHHGYYLVRGRDGLGYGDVKFLAVAGIWLGLYALLPFLFIAGLLGVVTGLLWHWLDKGEKFPFAPSLAISFWLCMLFPNIPNILLYIPH